MKISKGKSPDPFVIAGDSDPTALPNYSQVRQDTVATISSPKARPNEGRMLLRLIAAKKRRGRMTTHIKLGIRLQQRSLEGNKVFKVDPALLLCIGD